MRTIKQLLQVMLDNQQYFSSGLCGWATDLHWVAKLSNDYEYGRLMRYIRNNRPSKFSSIDAFKQRNSSLYWTFGDVKPRIKWLKNTLRKILNKKQVERNPHLSFYFHKNIYCYLFCIICNALILSPKSILEGEAPNNFKNLAINLLSPLS